LGGIKMDLINNAETQIKTNSKSKTSKFFKEVRKQKFLLLLMVPGILWFIVFKYLPLLGLSLAFTDYGFRPKVSIIGFDNFKRLFSSTNFWVAFKNTIIISLLNIIFYFPLPIILALCMNELISVKIKKTVQFVVYIPYFFSWVIVGSVFATMLSPSSGIVNEIIKAFGYDSVFFMADPRWFRGILIISYIWRNVGYGTVIYVATLATVDTSLYDAATVDGAGYWKRMLHVTLPGIRSTIATMLLLNISHVLNIFEQVLVMYNAAVYSVSDVLMTYSFREGLLNSNIGYAIAIGLFTSIVSLILVLGTNKLSERFLDESIL
jgi:ABC-type polysaccharide transport system, permease component